MRFARKGILTAAFSVLTAGALFDTAMVGAAMHSENVLKADGFKDVQVSAVDPGKDGFIFSNHFTAQKDGRNVQGFVYNNLTSTKTKTALNARPT